MCKKKSELQKKSELRVDITHFKKNVSKKFSNVQENSELQGKSKNLVFLRIVTKVRIVSLQQFLEFSI